MPYIFAHPAAALPLRACMGRFAVLSALVIGTLAPDLWYIAPSFASRDASHSTAGLLIFCLPVGILLYVLFHRLLKHPLLALLPREVAIRLHQPPAPRSRLAIPASLMAGSASHFLWDAFTHEDGFMVESLSFLRVRLATFGEFELYAYSALQHLSTAIGVGLILYWLIRRYRSSGVAFSAAHLLWLAVTAVIAALSVVAGLAMLFDSSAQALGLQGIRDLARDVFSGGLKAFAASLLIYAALWHLRALYDSARRSA